MKQIILILFASIVLVSCATKITEEDYYMNEDFTLIDREETTSIKDNSPVTVWTWVIKRNITSGDSIEIAKISNLSTIDEQSCGCGDARVFTINNELWYNKKVGDNLHFDYIRRSRFFKVVKSYETQSTAPIVEQPQLQIQSTPMGDLETERKIMELERQKIQIELELEKLKIK